MRTQINNYNTRFEPNSTEFSIYNEQRRAKKRWWKRLWQAVAVTFSDAVGGLVGGPLCGGVTSGLVGVYVFTQNPKITFELSISRKKMPSVNGVSTSLCPEDVGSLHNLVLAPYFTDSLSFAKFGAMSDLEKGIEIASAMKRSNHSFEIMSVIDEQVAGYVLLSQKLKDAFVNSESFEEFADNLRYNIPLDEEMLEVLIAYMNGLRQTASEESLNYYLDDMVKFINKSTLSESAKKSLLNGFYIGKASDDLWNRQVQYTLK